ncbi:MAG: hypothetical protein GC184_10050 [Rhizobiales bacterium]|nr:hypothetical protein [Hyphomicrobiales bacterium]
MLSAVEIVRSLNGVWRIIRRDASAVGFFDLSYEGFLRSFAAMFVAMPFIIFSAGAVLHMALEIPESRDYYVAVSPTLYALVELGDTMVCWAILLLVMVPVSRQMELGRSFTSYAITYNWGAALTHMLFALPLALYMLGAFQYQTAVLLSLPVMALVGYYRWLIARQVLGATALAASGIVVLDFLISLTINEISGLIFFPNLS